MDRNKPGYMNFNDIADRLESGKLNAYDVVYTKDTHEVVFIKEDLSLIRMKCRLDVYPSVVVAEYYLNLNTDTYVGQIVGIKQGEWICLYNVNYADNKFIVRKVGVDEYGQLTNKPQINGVTLEGNKTTEQLGIHIPTKFSQLYDDVGYVTFDHLIENYYSKSQTYSKSEVDNALAGKADTNDIPTDLADLQDDSTHRTVTDENIAAWNAKSNVVANPSETTGALNSIEIDGVAYAIAGSGGGAVNSVNGKTGHVILNASDVGALPDDTDIPSQLSDLDEDSTHRVVTDAEKVAWNNKSDFSGSYRDLTDQPTIPSALSQLNDDTTHRVVTDTEKNTWNNKSDFSGSYNDLTDQPTIPTVNNPTITIQKNGQSVDSFTLNQSGNKSINMVVPTKTSDLSNDSNFINSTVNNLANYYLKSQTYTQAEVDALIDAAINGRFRKVNVLPVTGEPNIIYLVPKADPETSDACDEYIWQDNAWELIGSTNIDLSGYVTDEELTTALADYLTISVFSTTIANYYNKTEIGALLDDKVDKVDGKGLSTYDYDAAAKAIVDSVTANLANKVDKVTGKGLSTNDYDATAKGKVDALGTASTKNVPTSGNAGTSEVVMGNDTRLSDARNAADVYNWAKAATKPSYTKSEVGLGNVDNTSDATKKTNFTGSIANGDTGFVTGGDAYTELAKKVDQVEGKTLSSNDFTDTLKNKLDGIAAGAEVNVQSDWNQTTDTADDYIKNKPTKVSDFTNDSGFTKVEASTTNGNIKIDSTETTVYDDSDIQELIDTDETETEYANPLSLETMQAQTAKNTKIKLEPIQDLHGYDKPWTGGAGKNKLPLDIVTIKSLNTAGTWSGNVYTIGSFTFTINTDDDGNITEFVGNGTGEESQLKLIRGSVLNELTSKYGDLILSGCPQGGGQNTYGIRIRHSTNVYQGEYGNGLSILSTRTYDDYVLLEIHNNQVANNLKFYPMIRLATESDATFQPYTNIASISGHDQIDILGCGKNMLGCMEVASDTTGIAEFNGDEIKVVSVSNGSYKASNFIWDILPSQWGKRIYISCASATSSGSNDWRINLRTSSDGINYIERINITGALATKTMLIPEDTVKMMLLLYSTSAVSGNAGDYAIYKKLQLEFNEDGATEYELPQSSNDLSIDLPSTVYGGVLDLESGILTVTHNRIAITSDISISKNSDGWNAYHPSYYFFFSPSGIIDRSNITCISNIMVGVTRGQIQNTNLIYACSVSGGGNEIDFTSDLDNTTDVKQFLINNNAEFVYELATPTTIQLTPHQLSLLKAQNNLTTSQYTQIKVTYRNGIFATLEPATDLTDGLMSAMDKLKLDNIVPATTTTDGLMTATDKTKLDGVATSATKTESSTTNGNIKINGTETQVYDDSEIKGELSTDTSTIEGNPLNFSTLSAQTAKSTILSLEPIQDLHGYDKPWTGGAGKNKCPLTISNLKAGTQPAGSSWNGNVYTHQNVTWTFETLEDNDTIIKVIANGLANQQSTLRIDGYYKAGNYIANGLASAGSYTTFHTMVFGTNILSTNGSNVSVAEDGTYTYYCFINAGYNANNVVFYPMIRLSTESDPTFAPYTNICPITGRTEIGILGCGKNLLPNDAMSNTTSEGVKYTILDNNGVNLDGTSTNSSASKVYYTNDLKLKEGNYKLVTNLDLLGNDKIFVQITDSAVSKAWKSANYTSAIVPFTVTSEMVNNMRVRPVVKANQQVKFDLYANIISVNNEFDSFSPYTKSNDLTISLGQTVYGIQIKLEEGKGVVDKGYKLLTDLSYTYDSTYHRFVSGVISNMKLAGARRTYFVSSSYEVISDGRVISEVPNYAIYSAPVSNGMCIAVHDPRYNTEADFLVGVANQSICYPLETPTEISLTPQAINLLKGVNNISTDGDKITLTYRDGSVATLGDLTSAVDNLDSKIDESKILTDTATGDKYILVVTNGVLSVEQVSN